MKLYERKSYPGILVLLLSLLGFSFPAGVTQFSMVAGDLAGEMGVPVQTVLIADSLRAVCLVSAMFLSGYVYKRLGMRRTIILGVFFQVVSQFSVPAAVSLRSLPLLFIFKGMQGLNALAFPLYISVITQWVDRRYCGLATAVFNGSFTAGAGIGAWAVGRLVPVSGWRASFYLIGGICLLFALPVLLTVRENPARSGCTVRLQKKKNVYGTIIRNPATWLLVVMLVANTWVAQAVTVDMSVFAQHLGYSYEQTGTLMLLISVVTVVSSILGGWVSDFFAARSENSVRTRSLILAAGYVLSAAAAAVLSSAAVRSIYALTLAACAMMSGVSWSAGVFWALPSEIYSAEDNVAGTAFCSGASNIPNPIAPAVVGVLLGTHGYWTAGWMTCLFVSLLSAAAAAAVAGRQK